MAKQPSTKPFITTTQGQSGWFAVKYWWNPEMGGFWEPWDTGIGRYQDEAKAIEEAETWAEQDEIAYVPRVAPKAPG